MTEPQVPKTQPDSLPAQVVGVRFQQTGKIYHFDPGAQQDLRPGDFVLVETARGQQLGEVVSLQPHPKGQKNLKPIQRRATGCDLARFQQWRRREKEALEAARQAVKQFGLPFKIVAAEYTFDGELLTLLYVSEEDHSKKSDFAKLQKHLQHLTTGNIELRRIGVRDQAKLMGGYGVCGERRCCSHFLSEFKPVSIKAAKTQGVSLNPEEITGICGKLRCCLVYEQEQYEEACQMMPRRKKRVRTRYGEGKVVDLLPMKQIVVVQVEDQRLELPLEEVEVIHD